MLASRTPRGREKPPPPERGFVHCGKRPEYRARRDSGRNVGCKSAIPCERRHATWPANNPSRPRAERRTKGLTPLRRTECDCDNVGRRIARNYKNSSEKREGPSGSVVLFLVS